ncbi:MAG: hypothetical protein JNL70_13390 [Saprospiraceae bacterium]|nr:hypothetical protein [Saprospiraceae bacterium]
MTKQRVTPINKAKEEAKEELKLAIEQLKIANNLTEPLASETEATKAIATATKKPLPTTKTIGRPIKENSIGRAKFTTALRPDVVKWLKKTAIDQNITTADLLEIILDKYISE